MSVLDRSPRFVDDGIGAGVARRRSWERRYARLLVGYDGLVGIVAAVAAYTLRFSDGSFRWTYGYAVASFAAPVLWVCAVALAGGYESRILGLGSEEFQRIFRAFVGMTATVGFVSYALKADVARGYIVLALPLAMVLSFLGHYAARKRLHRGRSRGRFTYRVIAVGGEESVADLTAQLRQERYAGMQVVGACLSSGDGARLVGLGVPLLGGLDDVADAVRASNADTVAVAAGASVGPARLRRLSWQLEGTDTDLVVAPGLMEVAGPRLHIRPMTGLPLLHVEEPEFAGARRVAKAVVDRSLAVFSVLMFLPLMIGLWLAVRLSSPGPAVFKQTRTGQDGREFTLLKFRSMYVDAEKRKAELEHRNERAEGLLFKIRDDPRVTPVGRFLRRYSLDELPQLINVVQGKMSLVGPRPPLPAEVALYQDDVRRRLLVKPGLTGLWQISGRSDLDWDESVRLDLRYVENWSFTLDLMILWKTMSTVVRGRGAY
ncbi:MAG TPA: sugar transferase [Mycobacteriales bacterium]|nr:sugar transferase [Mycobacteriales bacterium]